MRTEATLKVNRLVVTLLCCAPLLADATDWLPVFRATSGTEYSIDKATLVVVSGDDRMIEAWDRESLPHPRGWRNLDGELINNVRRLVLHDCVRHRIEIIRFKVYLNDWLVDEVEDVPYGLAAPPYVPLWLAAPPYLLPGSGGEAIHKTVCELGAEQ